MSKRLIYAEDAIDAINGHFGFNIEEEYGSAVQEVINALPSAHPYTEDEIQKIQDLEQTQFDKMYELGMQSAQPESIHCKDCKWKQGSECVRFADVRPFPDDFCSRAERREE